MSSSTSGIYLEHANISTHSLVHATKFFRTAFPQWKIRGGGEMEDRFWIHIGTDEYYLALFEPKVIAKSSRVPYKQPGINHIAFVIPKAHESLSTLVERMTKAGYTQRFKVPDHKYRSREYFDLPSDTCGSGIEIEFIQYKTDDITKNNDYSDVEKPIDLDELWKKSEPNN
eukprot:CAMPEP_0201546186 /NCGR_PEP_ID=MMETSP0173_2-20130828/2556_1 /ASSEMBLY_ACC=CAM_ASM_000268 /TAXON_ID=218659 /ORGANISM="Vexillifera sp., Strain DIVA3 564/2" /LENGTH=170 /DNA_ID=CAMNT_0047954793 /DNA_START=43 /DNA_END=555 /DNA_ORIENTATION=+